MSKCIVIGGGVIGLFSAYYLAKGGHEVMVIDKSDFTDGCSYGNAGMLVPSHLIPLAQPGMVKKGVRWMLNSKSPFYVRPRLSAELLSWSRSFLRHAKKKHVAFAAQPLFELSTLSQDLYEKLKAEFEDFEYAKAGLLMLYKTEKVGEEEHEAAQFAAKFGLESKLLSPQEIRDAQANIAINCLGGVHYVNDSHLNPNRLMTLLKAKLTELKVSFEPNEEVIEVEHSNNQLQAVITKSNRYEAEQFIIAAGAWSAGLAKKLNMRIKLLPGKGYSFNVPSTDSTPTIPSILCEGKVAVTPMANNVRFGGTMEITSTADRSTNMNRVQGIVDTVNSFYPDLNIHLPAADQVWQGFRPCTSTGLPIIQRHEVFKNTVIGTGHGMMGLSLGPVTGLLLSQLIQEEKTDLELTAFRAM